MSERVIHSHGVTFCSIATRLFTDMVCFNGAVTESLPQTVTQHLRWIMQKDLLGQDVFLIGPPGPLRRSIAMQYLVTHWNLVYHKYFSLSINRITSRVVISGAHVHEMYAGHEF